MALYLGSNKVNLTLSPDNFYPIDTTWTRPTGWPNLDAISMDYETEEVYMTFDNDSTLPYHIACFYCTITGGYTVEVGYLNSNNQFITSFTETGATNSYVRVDYSTMNSTTYPYVVLHLIPATSTGHFTRCDFGYMTAAQLSTGAPVNALYYHNFCLERRGYLPYVNLLAPSSTSYGYCTQYMQKDATIIGLKNNITGTNFATAWQHASNLRILDTTGWDTSAWTITSLASVFVECHNLLKIIGIENWDTSHWAITTMATTFASCMRIEELPIGNWNTANWAVTNMSSTWSNCIKLRYLELNNWNTTNWAVTTLASAWVNCKNLNRLECNAWDTSNWRVTTLASTWNGCTALEILNLSHWDTSDWEVTTLASTWYYMLKLRQLKVGTWDTTNWAVTTLASTWCYCQSLEEWEAKNWHGVLGAIITVESTFAYCTNLKEIDFSNWGSSTTTWSITTMVSFARYCYNLERLIMHGGSSNSYGFNIASITTANNYGSTSSTGANTILKCAQSLKEFKAPAGWKGRIYFTEAKSLPRSQFNQFISDIVDNSSGTAITISMGVYRYKLTSEDIAAASAKGYTIAA